MRPVYAIYAVWDMRAQVRTRGLDDVDLSPRAPGRLQDSAPQAAGASRTLCAPRRRRVQARLGPSSSRSRPRARAGVLRRDWTCGQRSHSARRRRRRARAGERERRDEEARARAPVAPAPRRGARPVARASPRDAPPGILVGARGSVDARSIADPRSGGRCEARRPLSSVISAPGGRRVPRAAPSRREACARGARRLPRSLSAPVWVLDGRPRVRRVERPSSARASTACRRGAACCAKPLCGARRARRASSTRGAAARGGRAREAGSAARRGPRSSARRVAHRATRPAKRGWRRALEAAPRRGGDGPAR